MKCKPNANLNLILTVAMILAFHISAQAQSVRQWSVHELHKLVEKQVNYSKDSSLAILNVAAQKIKLETDKNLAAKYWAENHLRRADCWNFSSIDSTQKYLNLAYAYFSKHTDDKMLAEIFVLKSQISRDLRNYSLGEIYIDSALIFALQLDEPAFVSFVYYEKAFTQQMLENWEGSFESALLTTKYAETSGDSLNLATAYFLMGRTYHHFGLYNSAESFIEKSKNFGKGLEQLYSIIHIYADVLLQNEKTDPALAAYKEVLELALEKKDSSKAVTMCTNIGQILFGKKDFSGALSYYNKINEMLKSADYAGYKTLLFMAQMHFYLGEIDQTKADLNLFKTKFSDGRGIPRDINVYKIAADLHIALKELDEGTFYYKKWGILKDSLYSYTSKQQLNALEEMYFNERKKNEELSTSRQRQATMAGLLILVILVSGGLTYYFRIRGLKENEAYKYALKEKQMEQMIDAQEGERQRLARELHDGIGQSLAALKMQLQFDKNLNATTITAHRIDAICDEVRSLSHQMMPIVLKENGLQSALEQLIDSSFSASTIETDFLCMGLQTRLPDFVEVNIYRMTQELIQNILKHSEAKKVGIQLLKRGKQIVLIVEDDGIGLNAEKRTSGLGLSNIQIRLETLKGVIEIQSSEGKGTYINISVPLNLEQTKKTA